MSELVLASIDQLRMELANYTQHAHASMTAVATVNMVQEILADGGPAERPDVAAHRAVAERKSATKTNAVLECRLRQLQEELRLREDECDDLQAKLLKAEREIERLRKKTKRAKT